MKHALRFAAVLTAMPALANANVLADLYATAQQADATYAAAVAGHRAAREIKPQIRAQILPQVGANASISRSRQDSGQPVNDFATQKGAGIQLSQTVFDWAVFAQLRQIDEQLDIADSRLQGAEQELLLRVVSSYFDWLASEDNMRFARAEKEAIGQQLEQAKNRYEVGLSAVTDVQEAQARFDLAVAQEIQARSQLRSSREAIREITGTLPDHPVGLRTPIDTTPPAPADPEAWVDAAVSGNLQLRAARLAAELARNQLRERRAGHLPTISLNADYGYSEFNGSQYFASIGQSFTSSSEVDSGSISLNLNLPLFTGGATNSRVREGRSLLEQREAEQESSLRSATRTTRDAYDAVVTGVAQVKALRQAVASTRTALEAVQAGFSVGSRTSVDVLDAQRELYRAQRDLARARYDYVLSLLRLKQATGSLTGDDLLQVDALLVTELAS